MAGSSSNSSQNQSSSQSSSSTQVLDYPERAFLDSIAQYAGQVGQNVYNWAQGEYAKNSSLTDANITNYLNTSSKALTQAGALNDRYNNVINPEIDAQRREADLYASKDRQLRDMGAAESGQLQGTEAALANHKRDLQSFGIDPSAGRYAGLDEAARVSGAAAAVGAAQQAQRADETTGQTLRNQNIGNASSAAVAQNAGTINDYNTALQGFAGAENAGLANANTGIALQGAANPFLQTAASYKPITGTVSQSTSNSSGSSTGSSQTTDPAAAAKDQSQPKDQSQAQSPSGSGATGGLGGSGSTSSDGSSSSGSGDGSDPFSYDYGSGNGDYTDFTDAGGTGSADNFGLDYSGGSTYGFDSGGNMDTSGYNDPGAMDYGGGGGGEYFAAGGAIPEDGGAIPESASPSRGAAVDDVRAQLPSGKPINVNAGEFVVPEDIVRFKGEEFFQKLIAQARKARVTAPAQPTHGAPQRQQVHA